MAFTQNIFSQAVPTVGLDQASNLGRDFDTWSFDGNWDGSGANSTSAMIADRVMSDPELMKQLGLTDADIGFKAGGYEGDSVVDDRYTLSDKAKQALAGLSMSRTGFAGKKDGRSQVLRDGQGNILSIGKPYSYDPAGDLKDAALKGVAVMGAAYGAGQLLGLGEAAGAAGASGASGGAAASSAGGSALQGIPALAGDFGAVSASAGAWDAAISLGLGETIAGGAAAVGGLADKVMSGADWLGDSVKKLTGGDSMLGKLIGGSGTMGDILGLVGAGVQQWNLERMADDQRKWQDKKEADARRRQAPVSDNIFGRARVIAGGSGG